MARLADRLIRRRGYWEGMASGAATVLSTTWGAGPAAERVDPGAYLSYATAGYGANGIVFAVIGARMHLFAEAEPRILDTETGRLVPRDGRLDPLMQPWTNGTSGDLLARMEQDVSLAGNSYVVARDGGGLARLRPDWVSLVVDLGPDGIPTLEGYLYSPSGGAVGSDSVAFQPDEVGHYCPIPDPLAAFRGMSWLTPVVREIDADTAMTTHKIRFLENAASPNLLVSYASKLGPEALDKLRARFEARHAGADNAWKTLVLDEGADAKVIGNTFEQMTFTAVQAAGENRIAAAAGTPGIVVGLKEGLTAATYSNYEQAMRRFADGTMRPLWRSAGSTLERFVDDLKPHERLVLDASSVEALREGESARAEMFRVKAVTTGELIRSGFKPETVADAVDAYDLSLLEHTGNTPTALYDPNQPQAGGEGKPAAKDSPLAQGDKGGDYSGA